MPKATSIPTTLSRRAALTSSAIIAAGLIAGAGQPQSNLLALCEQFHQHHRVTLTALDAATAEAAHQARGEATDQLRLLHPTSKEEWAAKIGVALVLMEEANPDDEDDGLAFASATVRGLIRAN